MIPVNNNILVKTSTEDTKKTKGGVILATDTKMRNKYTKSTGVIVSIGSFVGQEYSELEEGDEVRFREHSGYSVKDDDDYVYRIIQDVDIYAVTKKGK